MTVLIHGFSLPWYFYVGLGGFITLFIVNPKFRSEIDVFLAHVLGLQPKKKKGNKTLDNGDR